MSRKFQKSATILSCNDTAVVPWTKFALMGNCQKSQELPLNLNVVFICTAYVIYHKSKKICSWIPLYWSQDSPDSRQAKLALIWFTFLLRIRKKSYQQKQLLTFFEIGSHVGNTCTIKNPSQKRIGCTQNWIWVLK